MLAEAQPAMSEPRTPTPSDREHEEDARVDHHSDGALPGADGDGDEDEEVWEEGYGGRELEDAAVGFGRYHVLLLGELHTVGDELGPPVETAGRTWARAGPAYGP